MFTHIKIVFFYEFIRDKTIYRNYACDLIIIIFFINNTVSSLQQNTNARQ